MAESESVQCNFQVDGDGPLVTFIHGIGSAIAGWDGIVAELSDRFRCLRYDLRGHGESPLPPLPYGLDEYVADLAALLDRLDVSTTHLVGHSLGGMIAQGYALRYPERVGKIVLVSTVNGRNAEERQAIVNLVETLEREGAANILDRAIERWFTADFVAANPDVIARRKARVLATDADAFAAAFRTYAEQEYDQEIRDIRVPTLIMTGEYDVGANVRMARLMHERIPGARLEILTDLRHAVLAEAPGLVASHITGFLTEA
jgi:pimeloyl-ACP methyl ester carboxylesterase